MRSFEINKTDIVLDYRFEPSYYYYSKVLHKELENRGIQFVMLNKLCDYISDGEHSALPRLKEGTKRYLYGRNLKDGIVNYDSITDSSYISDEDYEKYPRIYINENDILMTIVGTVGNVALYRSSYIGIAGINRNIAKIAIKKESWATPEYIMAYFMSKMGKHQISNITTGNVQPLLSLNNIKTIKVPQLPESDVEKITVFVQKYIDKEIEALRLIEQAKNIFKKETGLSCYIENKCNYFETNLSEINKEGIWTPEFSRPRYSNIIKFLSQKHKLVMLRELISIGKGDEVGSENYNTDLQKLDSDVPFIRTSDIVNYDVDLYPDYYIQESIYDELNQEIRHGDLVFSKDGKIGALAMITSFDKIILSSGFARMRCKRNDYSVTPEYIFIALSINEIGYYGAKKRTVVASTIPHVRENQILNIEIPIVDKSIIDEITNLVKKAFLLKDEKKKIMKEMKLFMELKLL